MQAYQDRQRELILDIEKGYRDRPTALNPGTADDFANDPRLALVCLYFVPEQVQDFILSEISSPLRAADPALYFYPRASLHLTVKNVRYINSPPNYTAADIQKVRRGFRGVVPGIKAFPMDLEWIFEQPSSLSVCGFSDDSLLRIVNTLNQTLIDVGVPDDKKYFSQEIFFGNVSFCRFQEPPNQAFREKVRELKQVKVGRVTIDKVWLVETDLVCHPARTRVLEEFRLAPG
jgi:2'-5' RNA ligase